MLKLLLATTNPGKFEELAALLADLPVNLVSPTELGLDLRVDESGATYGENATLKARAFAAASGLPALADDSGLEVDALGGAPGLHSAHYAPNPMRFASSANSKSKPSFPVAFATDADRRAHLLGALAGKPRPWTATFRSTVCLALLDGRIHIGAGACGGEISPTERGRGGFGYDRVFIVEGLGQTMAELSMDEKNRLSHRAKAVESMMRILKALVER